MPHKKSPNDYESLAEVLKQPSLYDGALHYLHQVGLPIPIDRLERDWSEPYTFSQGVHDAWKVVYDDTENRFQEYHLAEILVDIEYDFQLWRFKHFKTVERIIGSKTGTRWVVGRVIFEISNRPILLSRAAGGAGGIIKRSARQYVVPQQPTGIRGTRPRSGLPIFIQSVHIGKIFYVATARIIEMPEPI